MKIYLKLGVRLITDYLPSKASLRLRYPNNKAFLDIHDVLKGLLGLMGRSPRVRLALSITLKDDLSELKSLTFMLLSMCDSFAIVLKMEAP